MTNSIQLLSSLTVLLNAHAFRFSNAMRELWNTAGGTKHVQASKKLRVQVDPSDGSWKVLIDTKTSVDHGVSDFDKNRLEAEEVFTITGMRVSYDEDASAGKEGVLAYNKAMPSSIRNSVLKLTQGEADLFEKEISLLNNNQTATNIADEIIPLPIPVVLVGGKTFDFGIQFPLGATATQNKQYLEVIFDGYTTKRSSTKS